MKKLTLIFSLLMCLQSKAQIVLEHVYDSAGFFFDQNNLSQLYVVNLEIDGEKFVFIDRLNRLVRFYNLNHSPWRTISFGAATIIRPIYDYADIMYISQNLFDMDSEVEFMYVDQYNGSAVTEIINEDGSILFTARQAPFVKINVPQKQVPIYNTSSGTKMILSGEWGDSSAYVYGLIGTLNSVTISNLTPADSYELSNPFPNPSKDYTKVYYQLPHGVENGEVVFYNPNGMEVKRISVDRTFEYLTITDEDLPSGTYFYNLQTNKVSSKGKKMIRIK